MFQSDQLQELFYEKFDKSREEVFGAYRAVSKVVWNGNQVKGDQAIATFLRTLPESEHRLTSMDCQPIHMAEVAQPGILVSVNGTVKYTSKPVTSFAQTFVLCHDAAQGSYFIAYDHFRFQP
mmetsp:Transcript_38210/g.82810  ORF Transcript_38210/g.82810 Transcript_38210/m.82810 type:complete len:122 (+) Transcript_38210:115-480(+)